MAETRCAHEGQPVPQVPQEVPEAIAALRAKRKAEVERFRQRNPDYHRNWMREYRLQGRDKWLNSRSQEENKHAEKVKRCVK